MKKRILFVCLGNICRSPAAEGIMRRKIAEADMEASVEVDSAGTYGGHAGELPDSRMRAAASKRGLDLTHRSRKLTTDDFERFDMIVVMDDSNYENACRMAPDVEALGRVCRMVDFCTRFDVSYVPDPYYEGREGFERVLDILEDACSGLLEQIKKEF